MKADDRYIQIFIDYIDYFDDVIGQGAIFRGMTNYKYELRPAVGRYISSPIYKGDIQLLLHHEKLAFFKFKNESTPFTQYGLNDWEYLALAQHHGLPTRLLDWTGNILAALFFAVEDANKNKSPKTDGVVYCIPKINSINNHIDFPDINPLNPPYDAGYLPSHITKNIIAQNGIFTIHKNPTVIFKPKELRRVLIPAEEKMNFKKYLFQCGITRTSLFPDLYGLTTSIKHQYFEM